MEIRLARGQIKVRNGVIRHRMALHRAMLVPLAFAPVLSAFPYP